MLGSSKLKQSETTEKESNILSDDLDFGLDLPVTGKAASKAKTDVKTNAMTKTMDCEETAGGNLEFKSPRNLLDDFSLDPSPPKKGSETTSKTTDCKESAAGRKFDQSDASGREMIAAEERDAYYAKAYLDLLMEGFVGAEEDLKKSKGNLTKAAKQGEKNKKLLEYNNKVKMNTGLKECFQKFYTMAETKKYLVETCKLDAEEVNKTVRELYLNILELSRQDNEDANVTDTTLGKSFLAHTARCAQRREQERKSFEQLLNPEFKSQPSSPRNL